MHAACVVTIYEYVNIPKIVLINSHNIPIVGEEQSLWASCGFETSERESDHSLQVVEENHR